MSLSLLRALWLFLTLAVAAGTVAAATRIASVVADPMPASREFHTALSHSLSRLVADAEVREFGSLEQALEWQPKVVVTVGMASLQQVRPGIRRPPLVAALVPRAGFERSGLAGEGRISAVFLDQPEERQLLLLTLLPGKPRTIGLISSPASLGAATRIRAIAQRLQFSLVEERVDSERDIGQALTSVSGRADVLLALPDPLVFNSQTIQNVLLTTYRARVPLVGFSQAYTRAGAMLSLHSAVRPLAEQTAEVVRVAVSGGALPAPQWPREFEVSVNRQVARSLGVELPAEPVLVERLRQREGGS